MRILSSFAASAIATLFAPVLLAQQPAVPVSAAPASSTAPRLVSVRNVADAYPGIRETAADSGRMRLGWHTFARYDWMQPYSMCEEAARWSTQRVWRHGEHDTAAYASRARDSTPAAVRAIVQRCASELATGVQQVLRGEGGHPRFFSLLHLALALHQEDQARVLLKGHLTYVTDRNEQSKIMQSVIDIYRLETYPPPIGLLEDATAWLDSVAKVPGTPQVMLYAGLQAHQFLWLHWMRVGDTSHFREAAAATERAVHTWPPGTILSGDWRTSMYAVLRNLAIFQHGVRSPDVVRAIKHGDEETNTLNLTYEVAILRLFGQRFAYPETDFWYAANGTPLVRPAGGDTATVGAVPAAPVPSGHVTLVWSANYTVDHTCTESRCYRAWLLLHKLLDKYGPRGLQLVIIAHTRGFAGSDGALTPEQEAPAIRQFYQDQLGLKALVTVDVTPYQTKQAPDGRRLNGNTPWEKRYLVSPLVATFGIPGPTWVPPSPWLLDHDGKIQMIGYGSVADAQDATDDPLLEMFIQNLLREKQ